MANFHSRNTANILYKLEYFPLKFLILFYVYRLIYLIVTILQLLNKLACLHMKHPPLNLPSYPLPIKVEQDKHWVFDSIRKKYLVLTPEEWVRQHFVWFLIYECGCPKNLIAVEMGLRVHQMRRRSDIVVFNKRGKACLIVECKAPHIRINQKTFDQIAQYNIQLQVKYLVVSNGLQHYCCYVDWDNKSYHFIENVPHYAQIIA